MQTLTVADTLAVEDALRTVQVEAPRGRSPAPGSGSRVSARRVVSAASAATLLATVGTSFYAERAQLAAILLATVAASSFVWAAGWLTSRPALAGALLLDLALVYGYLWSFDEHVRVTVLATPHGYTARVGDTTLAALRVQPNSGGIGLYSGDIHHYVVQPAAGRFDPTSPLAPVAAWLRFVAPKPAWSAISVSSPASAAGAALSTHPAPGWSYNRRGELEPALGAPPLLMPSPGRAYRFTGELMRGDGTQGVLVQVTRNHGYVLLIRSDQDRAYWEPWNGRPDSAVRWTGKGTHVPHLSPSFVPMVQKTLLFALPSTILALTLLMLVIPFYAVAQLFLAGVRWPGSATRKEGDPGCLVHLEQSDADPGHSRACNCAACAIATWGLVAAAYVARGILKAVPNVPDSVAYLFQAKIFAAGRLWAPIPRQPDFFQETYLLMYHGHWFGKYAPGWPMFLALGVKLGVDWLVNPVLLAGCLLLMYGIGKRIYGLAVALLGTALAATSPFLLFFAGTFLSHTAALICFLAAVYLLVRWHGVHGSPSNGLSLSLRGWHLLVPAGLLLGMALITRELDTIGLALPFACLFVRRPLAIGLVAVAAAVPVCLGLALNQALTGSVLTNPYVLVHPWDRMGFGHAVGDPAWHIAFTPAMAFWNLASNIQLLQVSLFGWPYYFALAFVGIPFVVGRARRWDTLLAASVAGLLVVYLGYFYSGAWLGFPRYTYGTIPWLALLTARGMQELYELALRLPPRRLSNRPAALAFPVLLSLGLVAYSLALFVPAERSYIAEKSQGEGLAPHGVRGVQVHHALVFTSTPGAWWSFGELITETSPLLNGDVVYARDLGPRDRQLMRLYPGRRYYRLDGTALTPMRP